MKTSEGNYLFSIQLFHLPNLYDKRSAEYVVHRTKSKQLGAPRVGTVCLCEILVRWQTVTVAYSDVLLWDIHGTGHGKLRGRDRRLKAFLPSEAPLFIAT
jgi:hypothetical protein